MTNEVYIPHGIQNLHTAGELVEYLNTDALADSICQLIEHPELRKSMGKKAKENIKRFSRDIVMKQWTEMFSGLLSQ